MQIYKNLANSLFIAQNKESYKTFNNTTQILGFIEKLKPRSFYNTYKDLYLVCKLLSFLSQIATAFSSYYFINNLVSLQNEYLKLIATICILLLIELVKYTLLNKALFSIYGLESKTNYTLLILALLVSLLSMFFSISGGSSLAVDVNKTIEIENKHDKEITTIRNEIKQIQDRNSYRGKTYIVGKDKTLLLSKEAILSDYMKRKDKELQNILEIEKVAKNGFKIGFCLFDCLFLICTFYTWSFIKKSAIEEIAKNCQLQEEDNLIKPIQPEEAIIEKYKPEQRFNIGFSYKNNLVKDNSKIKEEIELIEKYFIKATKETEQSEFLNSSSMIEYLSTKTAKKLNPIQIGKALNYLNYSSFNKYNTNNKQAVKGYYVIKK